MSACPQCGTVAKPSDKFCNTCGTPVARPAAGPPNQSAAPQYGGPPPQPQGYGAPAPGPGGAPARCQMGHDIAPGASYCAQGHPIALDAMQFANDAYGPGGGGGYAQQPPQAQAYGQQPPPQYGAAPQPYGAPQPSPSPIGGAGGFGAPDPMQQQGYGGGGYGQQPPPMNPQFGPQGTPYPGTPAQQQPQYGGVPQAQPPQYGGAPPYGGAPQAQQPVFNPAPAPPVAAPAPAAPSAAPAAVSDPNNKTLRGFLVAYQTNTNGDFWPLTGGRLVVGRAGAGDGIDVQLSDPTISSRHAVIVVDGALGTLVLEDTGSTNGTFVNDDHLGFNGRRDLRDGDRLRFGGFTTIVKVVGRV